MVLDVSWLVAAGLWSLPRSPHGLLLCVSNLLFFSIRYQLLQEGPSCPGWPHCESFNLITSAKSCFPSKVLVTGGLSQRLRAWVLSRPQAPSMLASSCWHLSWKVSSAKGSCFTKGYAPSSRELQDSAQDVSKDSSSSGLLRGQTEDSAAPAQFTSSCLIPLSSPASRCRSQEHAPGNYLRASLHLSTCFQGTWPKTLSHLLAGELCTRCLTALLLRFLTPKVEIWGGQGCENETSQFIQTP